MENSSDYKAMTRAFKEELDKYFNDPLIQPNDKKFVALKLSEHIIRRVMSGPDEGLNIIELLKGQIMKNPFNLGEYN